jgi:hypothetical protein
MEDAMSAKAHHGKDHHQTAAEHHDNAAHHPPGTMIRATTRRPAITPMWRMTLAAKHHVTHHGEGDDA